MCEEFEQSLFELPSVAFTNHIKAPNNDRIIFSGKFGNGKSTFLLNFFENQTKYLGSEMYEAFFIDPVHYSVASNEDILRYIKYDILISLLYKKASIETIELGEFTYFSHYVKENYSEIIKRLLAYVPKVGKTLKDVIQDIESLNNDFKKFKNSIKETEEDSKINKFMNEIEGNSYSIYENDILTVLVRHLLQKTSITSVSQDNEHVIKKEKVLIIDNLDRIDPEHIFRILNVFSTHIDYKTSKTLGNKFDFDKIIIVCDIKNIRTIFHNKYGEEVDFQGYLDKFYSKEIFYFQNYDSLKIYVSRLIKNLQIGFTEKNPGLLNSLIGQTTISELITLFIQTGHIGLREVISFCSSTMLMQTTRFDLDGIEIERNPWDTPVLEVSLLAKLMGGANVLLKAIDFLKTHKIPIKNIDTAIERHIIFLTREAHKFQRGNLRYSLSVKEAIIEFGLDNHNGKLFWTEPMVTENIQTVNFRANYFQFYEVYSLTIQDLSSLKLIE